MDRDGKRSRIVALVWLATVVGVVWISPASALTAEDAPGSQDPRCLRDTRVRSFAVDPATIQYGQSTTLSWDVEIPAGCAALRFDQGTDTPVGPQGSRTLTPGANSTPAMYATSSGIRRKIASTEVAVNFPRDFTITLDSQAPALRQLLGSEGQTVRVHPAVRLDLTGGSIPVAKGVRLIGERNALRDGPLLFTRSRPEPLLSIQGDNVRITGLRIRGPDMGVSDGSNVRAIAGNSIRHLEVDNNEIAGFRGVGVEIRDNDRRISTTGPPLVRIHDNYIHHNQNYGRLGYGVAVKDNATVWIERNVFDYNRHAIEGDGDSGTAYHAYDNLVLPNGGKHKRLPQIGWIYTHQFDMHGQQSCGFFDIFSDSLYNCGTAGHHMDIRYNAFLYTRDEAIKLRGTPYVSTRRGGGSRCGAQAVSNTFKHTTIRSAMQQTETGLCQGGNRLGYDSLAKVRRCDVNGDGQLDNFLATGQNWWYSTGPAKHWVFVRRTKETPNRCPSPPPAAPLNPPTTNPPVAQQ